MLIALRTTINSFRENVTQFEKDRMINFSMIVTVNISRTF